MPHRTQSSDKVIIHVGRDSEIAIDAKDCLVVQTVRRGIITEHVSFGPATKKRIEEIISYLERLYTFVE